MTEKRSTIILILFLGARGLYINKPVQFAILENYLKNRKISLKKVVDFLENVFTPLPPPPQPPPQPPLLQSILQPIFQSTSTQVDENLEIEECYLQLSENLLNWSTRFN
jgi:hypothetical protein